MRSASATAPRKQYRKYHRPLQKAVKINIFTAFCGFFKPTGLTGLEPATSAVTGRCSNQLNYSPLTVRAAFFSARFIFHVNPDFVK
jgi:hypothetical protein